MTKDIDQKTGRIRVDTLFGPWPVERGYALSVGAKYFFTGRPCSRGHIELKSTKHQCCMECNRIKSAGTGLPPILPTEREILARSGQKRCSMCGEIQSLKNFGNDKHQADGKKHKCRECVSVTDTEWRLKNPDKAKEIWRKSADKFVSKRREESRARSKERRHSPETREHELALARQAGKKRRSTVKGKLNAAMTCGMWASLKGKKNGRKWVELAGFSCDELKRHLESLFQPGMSWENYGLRGWHIDHKIPIAAFNFSTPDDIDFKRCWALSNLQPLWAFDNMSKGAKTPLSFQPSLALALPANDNRKREDAI